jgi:hypothetical protein
LGSTSKTDALQLHSFHLLLARGCWSPIRKFLDDNFLFISPINNLIVLCRDNQIALGGQNNRVILHPAEINLFWLALEPFWLWSK